MEAEFARSAAPPITATITAALVSCAAPDVRQNRSKLAATFSQATSRPDATILVVVLFLPMALPFLVESTPRAYRLKAGNADLAISTD